MGFIMTPEEAEELKRKDARNGDVLFPYLNGEDLNSRPDQSPSRCVIYFRDWPLKREAARRWAELTVGERKEMLRSGVVSLDYPDPVASDYPDCLAIVEQNVKPERERNKYIDHAREQWWQFERTRPELYTAIAGMERVLVRSRIANMHAVTLAPSRWVSNEKVVVFARADRAFLAIIQSGIHEAWARHYTKPRGSPDPAELLFFDSEARLVKQQFVPAAIADAGAGTNEWFAACRNGRVYAFSLDGAPLWNELIPYARRDNSINESCGLPVLHPTLRLATEVGVLAISAHAELHGYHTSGLRLWSTVVPRDERCVVTKSQRKSRCARSASGDSAAQVWRSREGENRVPSIHSQRSATWRLGNRRPGLGYTRRWPARSFDRASRSGCRRFTVRSRRQHTSCVRQWCRCGNTRRLGPCIRSGRSPAANVSHGQYFCERTISLAGRTAGRILRGQTGALRIRPNDSRRRTAGVLRRTDVLRRRRARLEAELTLGGRPSGRVQLADEAERPIPGVWGFDTGFYALARDVSMFQAIPATSP